MYLPGELYDKIFRLLSKPEVLKCIGVCKEWSFPAARIYYEELSLSDSRLKKMKPLLFQEQYFQHYQFVQSLTMKRCPTDEGDRVNLSRQEFSALFNYMPNLKQLKIYPNSKLPDYFIYLLSTSLPYLESITIEKEFYYSRNDQPSNLHYIVYYNFCESLKSMKVVQSPGSMIETEYGGIYNYLGHFKRLTHLEYTSHPSEDISLYHLQVACPTLNSIHFISETKIPKMPRNTPFSFKTLKELKLSFPKLTATYSKYIAEHLPSSVKKIEIVMKDTFLHDWIDEVGIKTAIQLYGRLSKLEYASIEFSPKHNYNELEDNYDLSMTNFYRLLNAFKGDKKVFVSATFAYGNLDSLMKFSDGAIHFNYPLLYENIYDDRREPVVPALKSAVPNKSVSIIGPEIINQFTFNTIPIEYTYSDEVLKYALTNCPNSQYIRYNNPDGQQSKFQISDVIGAKPGDSFKKFNPMALSRDILKVVRLENILPSPEFLNPLVKHLPNIQVITCKNLCVHHHEYVEELDHYGPEEWILDLSKFKNLNIFYFDIQLILKNFNGNHCFMKFLFTDGEKQYYHCRAEREGLRLITISENIFQLNQIGPVGTLTFKCNKIMQFALYDPNLNHIIELRKGRLQKHRRIKQMDAKFISLI